MALSRTPRNPAVRVGITADRRWDEQARMFRSRGVEVLHGPSMRTIDLSADESLRAVTEDLGRRPPDYLVVTTGMGMAKWLEAAAGWGIEARLLTALSGCRVVTRGAKATSAARRAGLDVWWRAPKETMREIVEHLSAEGVGAARVALQVFDPDDHPSTESLTAIVGELIELPVYHWALPRDLGPAERLIETAVNGSLAAVTFTAQPAVHHLFRIAERLGAADDLRSAFNGALLASCVGAVCASAAQEEGVTEAVWPDPPRLAAMVKQVMARVRPDDP